MILDDDHGDDDNGDHDDDGGDDNGDHDDDGGDVWWLTYIQHLKNE